MVPIAFCLLLGAAKPRMQDARARAQWSGLVQIHHIIPREHRAHATVQEMGIHAGENLMFLPTRRGKKELRTVRRVHDGGHRGYNVYVGRALTRVHSIDELRVLIHSLRSKLRKGVEIPWL